MKRIAVALLLTSCAGSRGGLFSSGVDASGVPSFSGGVDSAIDSGTDTIGDGAITGDGAVKLYFDSSRVDETETDTLVDDGGWDAPTLVDVVSTCTPLPESSQSCGSDASVITPREYCVLSLAGTTGHYPHFAAPMPSGCRCAETYDCACLLAHTSDPCRGFSTYDGGFSGCNDTGQYVLVDCP
jgi:hypothetical protein